MTDREAFEAWAKEKGTPFYLGGATQEYSLFAWQAWQAATTAKDAEIAALKAERDELLKAVEAVDDLIQHSHGVVGLHLNGDVAPWSELQTGGCNEGWLIDFDAAIAKAEGGAA